MNARLARHSLSALFFVLITGGAAFLCASMPSMVWAQEAAAPSTSDEERYQANLRRWQSMTEEEREAIRNRAASMSEEDRTALKEKVKQYRAMPEQDREALRDNFRRFRELPPERREALEQKDRQFRQLPPEKRADIRRSFQEERRARNGQGQGPATRPAAGAADVRPRKALPGQVSREKIQELYKKKQARYQQQQKPKGLPQGREAAKPALKGESPDGRIKAGPSRGNRPHPRKVAPPKPAKR